MCPEVCIVYCDTGMEIPPIKEHVLRTMAGLKAEFAKLDLPFTARIVEPRIEDRFLVKVLGKGYPPLPTCSVGVQIV